MSLSSRTPRAALASATLLFLGSAGAAHASPVPSAEVIVALRAPSLANAVASSRALTTAARTTRLDADGAFGAAYLRSLAAAQRELERSISAVIPGARIRRRYGVVLNGLAVIVPSAHVARLASLPGVARMYPSLRYRAFLDRSVPLIGVTPELLGPSFANAGNGVKIAVLDDGIDHGHPFFDPTAFAPPTGFPRGNTRFTTAKVIVARAFPPAPPRPAHAAQPFHPDRSQHGTQVAGVAAGNTGVTAPGYGALAGVAPRAYLGNYRVLTIPSGSSMEGNSAEILSGIEAAVRDGMDVLNLSLGMPEVQPGRDVVTRALEAAARVGVVAVVSAGNDFPRFGGGSVGSPASARSAIAVAAVGTGRTLASGVLAGLSSAGPTPLSLRAKPDVSAPGAGIVTSLPGGAWAEADGTSVAAPHVAGAVALLLQRHPDWTADQIASALVSTASPVYEDAAHATPVPVARQGGGLIDVRRAATPLVFTSPRAISFGFVRPGTTVRRSVALSDAGGAGRWSAAVEMLPPTAEPLVSAPASVSVPGTLVLEVRPPAGTAEAELGGFIILTNGRDRRRVPFWLRVDVPTLPRPARLLPKPGTYGGTTAGAPARVDTYRYPDNPSGSGLAGRLLGRERVFRIRLRRQAANLGVVVLSHGKGVRVEPRIVVAGNESRQVGVTTLPLAANPLLPDFGELQRARPVAAALLPAAGDYDLAFDSPTPRGGGRFSFRVWVGDTTPPHLRLRSRLVRRGDSLIVSALDRGAGIDPPSVRATVDGRDVAARYHQRAQRITVDVRRLRPGRHILRLHVADFQEGKNLAAVRGYLPNTARLTMPFRIQPAAGGPRGRSGASVM
jgi:subtilisin family serine protease